MVWTEAELRSIESHDTCFRKYEIVHRSHSRHAFVMVDGCILFSIPSNVNVQKDDRFEMPLVWCIIVLV